MEGRSHETVCHAPFEAQCDARYRTTLSHGSSATYGSVPRRIDHCGSNLSLRVDMPPSATLVDPDGLRNAIRQGSRRVLVWATAGHVPCTAS